MPDNLIRLLILSLALCMSSPRAMGRDLVLAILDADYKSGLDTLASAYERIHPGVDVKINILPVDNYATWARAAIAGGPDTAPDIINGNFCQGFFEAGKTISLRPYLNAVSPYANAVWYDTFHPEHLERLKVVNDYAFLPLNFIEIAFIYNKDLFASVGVSPPATWEELLTVCERLKTAGRIPIAIPGDMSSYWDGTIGWFVRFFTDAYFFDRTADIVFRPGDFYFEEARDGGFQPDPTDPFHDMLIGLSDERRIQAVLDGKLRFDGPEMREIWTRLKAFSAYWQRGYHGSNATSAYQLFLTRRAAIMVQPSPSVMMLGYDMKDLRPENQFAWGVFRIPPLTTSPLAKIPFRGVGGPMPVWSITRKDKARNDLAADFIMYVTAPANLKILAEKTMEDERALVGPFTVKDAPLPPSLEERFAPFLGLGMEKVSFRGLVDEQESIWRFNIIGQDYMAGRLTLDEFLDRYQQVILESIPRIIAQWDLDMDTRTRDNNGALIAELEAITAGLAAAGPESLATREAFTNALMAALKDYAREVKQGQDPFDLVEERTIPIRVCMDEMEWAAALEGLPGDAKAGGYQYGAIAGPGRGAPRVQVLSFRPGHDDVVRNLSGARYTRDELRRRLRLE